MLFSMRFFFWRKKCAWKKKRVNPHPSAQFFFLRKKEWKKKHVKLCKSMKKKWSGPFMCNFSTRGAIHSIFFPSEKKRRKKCALLYTSKEKKRNGKIDSNRTKFLELERFYFFERFFFFNFKSWIFNIFFSKIFKNFVDIVQLGEHLLAKEDVAHFFLSNANAFFFVEKKAVHEKKSCVPRFWTKIKISKFYCFCHFFLQKKWQMGKIVFSFLKFFSEVISSNKLYFAFFREWKIHFFQNFHKSHFQVQIWLFQEKMS